jgi:hypothetical protein
MERPASLRFQSIQWCLVESVEERWSEVERDGEWETLYESDVKCRLEQVELVGTETEPSLFKALRMTWNYDFWVAGLWKLVNDMVVFIGPLMLQALIR